MKIDSYDMYHIGIKLSQFVNPFILKNLLKSKMETSGFEIFEKEELVIPRQIIGRKGDVNVEINWTISALNSIGKSPREVLKISKELLDSMVCDGYDVEKSFSFFEIITNVLIKIDDDPIKLLNNKITNKFPKPTEYLTNLDVIGLRVASGILETEKNEFFDMMIEFTPKYPKDCLFLRILFRTKKWDTLLDTHKILEDKIIEIFHSLEEK